ncbi:PTS IIA-like nitrogen regulatory protein PtsN [Thalassotalea euphylliae]|uniref:PTS IIA-like nitrogen-regulatory protein PtsN n=1 Tax=Thalassotalea euphylliae TaxID=1655234 RepID=A0A3E0U1R1_9GAMM|nr:PTS IIA-like nitrogen regulatory protein PtsN [Thalassotalea euphylliae]REL30640.1 PTS IIA-like nitrogen-regulatory protein PtsN [Thalassotalea euphylliae]REL34428.1 PTS IIA-like nitrogen-regulatory protein PtsN [Thalassotalea euphylliae]
MKLQDILTEDCTSCAVPLSSKKKILEQICSIATSHIPEHSTFELLQSLLAREKMGSTGIGNGIAIPHGRLTGTNQVVAVLMTTEQPVAFDAIDNRAVDIFVALFVPEDCCKDHLSTLQSIAKLLSNKQINKKIRKCTSNHELYELINQAE